MPLPTSGGGQEMGRKWYEQGRMFKKKNTFYDFIDCASYLSNEGYTSAEHLYAQGGSAGGLLMGAVINMAPERFQWSDCRRTLRRCHFDHDG